MSINQELVSAGFDGAALLTALGAEQVRRHGEKLWVHCFFHDEKTASMNLDVHSGLFHCFGCHAGGDLVDLVRQKLELSFIESCEWLMKFLGLEGSPDSFLKTLSQFTESNRFIERMQASQFEVRVYDEQWLVHLTKEHREFYHQKGFPDTLLDEFEVGYAQDGHGTPRLFFPIRDTLEQLVGVSGRRIDGQDESFKWIHTTDLSKNKLLYHLHLAKQYVTIGTSTELIVVEGPVDCMRAALYGKRNTVALLGHRISDAQKSLLMQYALKIVLALDADAAGDMGTKEAIQTLRDDFDVTVMPLPMGKDIGDLSPEEFETAYAQRERQ